MTTGNEAEFEIWIETLRTEVVQGEYGYEDGEYAVYPDAWKELFLEGLTPLRAFERALKAAGDARREDDLAAKANWERIQAEDAAAIARYRARH